MSIRNEYSASPEGHEYLMHVEIKIITAGDINFSTNRFRHEENAPCVHVNRRKLCSFTMNKLEVVVALETLVFKKIVQFYLMLICTSLWQ